MKIDLKRIQTFVLNLPTNTMRVAHMTALCERFNLNWAFVEGVKCRPPHIGCNINHLRAYRQDQAKTPLLILEDDCEATDKFTNILDIPPDADVVYLGATSCGIVPELDSKAFEGAVIVTDHDEQFCRVHNMTSGHAVLFVTEKALKLAIERSLFYTVEKFRPSDVGLAEIQSELIAYAYKQPMLYQSDKLQGEGKQHMERMTKIDLDEVPWREAIRVFVSGVEHYLKLTEVEDGRWHWRIDGTPKNE